MLKKEARRLYRDKRNTIPDSTREKLNDLILIQFQKLNLPFIETLFSYIAMENHGEVDPLNIIRFLKFTNPQLITAFPVCDGQDDTMKAMITCDEDEFVVNRFGTPEPCSTNELDPKEIDMIIVPLLCFDQKGYRVGYGKGFYDKFLATCRAGVIKIGLSYFDPINTISDRDDLDIPLSYCVTPQSIYEF